MSLSFHGVNRRIIVLCQVLFACCFFCGCVAASFDPDMDRAGFVSWHYRGYVTGACGGFIDGSMDQFVALHSAYWETASRGEKRWSYSNDRLCKNVCVVITTRKGQSLKVQVKDICQTCTSHEELSLSMVAFQRFEPNLQVKIIPEVSWKFVKCNDSGLADDAGSDDIQLPPVPSGPRRKSLKAGVPEESSAPGRKKQANTDQGQPYNKLYPLSKKDPSGAKDQVKPSKGAKQRGAINKDNKDIAATDAKSNAASVSSSRRGKKGGKRGPVKTSETRQQADANAKPLSKKSKATSQTGGTNDLSITPPQNKKGLGKGKAQRLSFAKVVAAAAKPPPPDVEAEVSGADVPTADGADDGGLVPIAIGDDTPPPPALPIAPGADGGVPEAVAVDDAAAKEKEAEETALNEEEAQPFIPVALDDAASAGEAHQSP